jgi:hypothetical protein
MSSVLCMLIEQLLAAIAPRWSQLRPNLLGELIVA